ncbi:MAG TPA: serine hydrolase [Gemmatimonadaceae bacterium]
MNTTAWRRVLLACGVVASLLYIATDLAAGMRYPGYSFYSQTISELSAIGAPTRDLVRSLYAVFNALALAFCAGVVWAAVRDGRALRITAALLVAYTLFGWVGFASAPIHVRGADTSGSDLPHAFVAGGVVVLLIATIAAGAFVAGRRFRGYSVATLLVMIAFSVPTFAYVPRVAANQPTPGLGILERVEVWAPMIWLAMFAVVLMRRAGRGASTAAAESVTVPHIEGFVAPGFEEVRVEFERNFRFRGEIGAAVAAYWRGEKVVDLWGGHRTPARDALWNEDTMVVVMSTTKGMAAMTLALANSRGWLDYDAPVARYWPEFAQNGKADVTVRQLLDHEAGLVLMDEKLTIDDMHDLDKVAGVLARQKPAWTPGTRHGYHAMTLGMYMQELIRRADPKHRTLGRFFHEEIAEPLRLEFYIGLPKSIPEERLAKFLPFAPTRALRSLRHTSRGFIRRVLWPWSMLRKSLAVLSDADLNERRCLEVELPAGNGVGTARAIARAYSAFAERGTELGISRDTFRRVTAPPAAGRGKDEVIGVDSYYSLGFLRPGPNVAFGSTWRTFGAPGAGGSFGFADPDAHVGYAYVMNKLDFYLMDDPREKTLRDAIYRAIDGLSPKGRPVKWVETPLLEVAAKAH